MGNAALRFNPAKTPLQFGNFHISPELPTPHLHHSFLLPSLSRENFISVSRPLSQPPFWLFFTLHRVSNYIFDPEVHNKIPIQMYGIFC